MRLHVPGRSSGREHFPCRGSLAKKKTLLHSPPQGLCSWPAPMAFGGGFLALSPLLDRSQACNPLVWPSGSREGLAQRKQLVPAEEHTVLPCPAPRLEPDSSWGAWAHCPGCTTCLGHGKHPCLPQEPTAARKPALFPCRGNEVPSSCGGETEAVRSSGLLDSGFQTKVSFWALVQVSHRNCGFSIP